MGAKIVAPGLEHAVAGTALFVVGPDDDEDELKDAAMEDMAVRMRWNPVFMIVLYFFIGFVICICSCCVCCIGMHALALGPRFSIAAVAAANYATTLTRQPFNTAPPQQPIKHKPTNHQTQTNQPTNQPTAAQQPNKTQTRLTKGSTATGRASRGPPTSSTSTLAPSASRCRTSRTPRSAPSSRSSSWRRASGWCARFFCAVRCSAVQCGSAGQCSRAVCSVQHRGAADAPLWCGRAPRLRRLPGGVCPALTIHRYPHRLRPSQNKNNLLATTTTTDHRRLRPQPALAQRARVARRRLQRARAGRQDGARRALDRRRRQPHGAGGRHGALRGVRRLHDAGVGERSTAGRVG